VKTTITIYIDAGTNQKCTDLGLNKSAICNEALGLAAFGGKEGTVEMGLAAFFKNKLEMLTEAGILRKERKKAFKSRHMENYNKALKDFAVKHCMELSQAVQVAESEK